MARKTKAITKQPKAERAVQNSADAQEDGDVFSQAFRDRLDQYSSLSKEVITRKADLEGNNPNQEIKDRRQTVSRRVEEASAAILKEELLSLEEWIEEQQTNLAEQVKQINSAYEKNKSTLESTGSFTAEEIEKQLQSVQERAAEKQSIHDSYGQLLERSKNIYN